MKKVLAAILVFVVLCAVVGFWTLKNFDQTLRSQMIEIVSQKTGRPLVIDGETKVHFSFSPYISFGNVKLANAAWATDPSMIEIGKLDVKVELWPLLTKEVKISRFALNDVKVNLETNQDGIGNWVFASSQAGKVDETADPAQNGSPVEKQSAAFAGLKNLEANDVSFQNVQAVLKSRKTGNTYTAAINTLNLSADKNGVALTSQWTVQGNSFDLSAKGNAVSSLLDGKGPYAFSIQANGSFFAVALQGNIIDPLKTNRIDASLKADMADMPVLAAMFNLVVPQIQNMTMTAQIAGTIKEPALSAFEVNLGSPQTVNAVVKGAVMSFSPLSATASVFVDAPNTGAIAGLPALPAVKLSLMATAGNGYRLDNVALSIGKSDLSGNFFVQTDKTISVQAKLLSRQLDLSDLSGRKVERQTGPVIIPPGKVWRRSPRETQVFSADPLPFGLLKMANVNVNYTVGNLIAEDGVALGKVAFSAVMQDGKFTLSDFKLANYVTAQAVFDASNGKTAAVFADINVNQMPLTLFFAKDGVTQGNLTAALQLKGQGESERAIAGSLNGRIFVNARNIQINSMRVLNLPKDLSFLSPADKSKPVKVDCAVINLPVVKGVLSSEKRIGLETDTFDMQANGVINLGTEVADLKIKASPRSGNVWESMINGVTVSGPLTSMRVSLNAEKSIDRALSIGMAYFMGGKKAAKNFVAEDALKNVCADAMAAK